MGLNQDNETAKRLSIIKRLLEGGVFAKAEKMISELEASEAAKSYGCCENPEVYWCKVLLKYKARNEADLISQKPDLESDDDFLQAVAFSQTVEQKYFYSNILIQIKQSRAQQRPAGQAEKSHKADGPKEDGPVNLNIGDFNEIGGGYVTFGAYPQSKKADNVKIGKIIDKECGYYLGSDNNLYAEWNCNYYKVEPIKWKVLSCANNEWFIVADVILEPHCFGGSDSDYANSEVRSWLNADFYFKAFRDKQKSIIMTTTVDNSLSSTGDSENEYTCDNTSDKVFLLSLKEAEQYLGEESRKRVPTEYAIARGAFQYTNYDNNYKREGTGCGRWWLRSPYCDYSDDAQCVDLDGSFYHLDVFSADYGVVPALKIKP